MAKCINSFDGFGVQSIQRLGTPSYFIAIKTRNRPGNQIVIGMADDFDCSKSADRQLAAAGANVNPAVNVRRIRLAARDEIISSFQFQI